MRGGSAKGTDDECREACIAIEVLAGLESPSEDKDARMAYQMKRLVEGMGGGAVNEKQQLVGLINGFLGL